MTPRALSGLSQRMAVLALLRRGPRTAEDLAVTLWRGDPARWALAGHPEHPDAGVVRARLADLSARGLATRAEGRLWQVTPQGRRRASR